MLKPKDVLGHEIEIGDIVVALMNNGPLIKGMAYKVNSIVDNSHVEIIHGVEHLRAYSSYFIKITSGLECNVVDLDAMAVRIQLLINSKPRSPLKNEIINALKVTS